MRALRMVVLVLLVGTLVVSTGCANLLQAAGTVARSQVWSDVFAFVLGGECHDLGYCDLRVARVFEGKEGQLIKTGNWTVPEHATVSLDFDDPATTVVRVDPKQLVGNYASSVEDTYRGADIPGHLHEARVQVARHIAAAQPPPARGLGLLGPLDRQSATVADLDFTIRIGKD